MLKFVDFKHRPVIDAILYIPEKAAYLECKGSPTGGFSSRPKPQFRDLSPRGQDGTAPTYEAT